MKSALPCSFLVQLGFREMCSQPAVRIELQHEAVIHLTLLMQVVKHLCLSRNWVQRGAHSSRSWLLQPFCDALG